MPHAWERPLLRWTEAGLLDSEAADRIRRWEATRPATSGLRWPVWLALGLGGLMLCAGVLLFVAAHWDALGPGPRFALVLAAVAALHLGGAYAAASVPGLASALHACGTVALGGGIFLSGQIFHLEAQWPAGLLLWALGAGIGYVLRRDWPQALLAALLTPVWLGAEWMEAVGEQQGGVVLASGLLLLALTYLGAESRRGAVPAPIRRSLVWAGAIAVIPTALYLVFTAQNASRAGSPLTPGLAALGWGTALGLPLAAALWLRGRDALVLLIGALWIVAGMWLTDAGGALPYLWCAGLAAGIIAWGVLERHGERINLGVAGFALTILVFYFSDVMDRLGRSAGLIGLGLLFLGGGYALERARRRLLSQVHGVGG
ncbi:MAG: DUF2157 domain-containing protein [Gemmatimonadales bacterium]